MTAAAVNELGYRVLLPGEPHHTGALAIAPLVDEWTGAAPLSVSARARDPRTDAHVSGGALVITGAPHLVRSNLATAPLDLTIDLLREGRPPQRIQLTIPMGSVLPYTAPPIAVTATTITLIGRVTEADFPNAPIPGAAVNIAGAGVGTQLVALNVPLANDHPSGTAMRARTLTSGPSTTLVAPARAGDRALVVAATAGIASDDVLAIGADLLVAAGINGSLVLLRTPVVVSAPAGATVTRQVVGPSGPPVAMLRAAIAGDGLLPTSGNLTAAVIEVVDGVATEYRRTAVITDADGRWSLSGVRGIPEVRLTTTATGFLDDGPRRCPLAPIDPFVRNVALRT